MIPRIFARGARAHLRVVQPPVRRCFHASVFQSRKIDVSNGDHHVHIKDHEFGKSATLGAVALRDSCTCSACTDPASGQKSFATTDIPLDIGISSVQVTSEGVNVKFSKDIPRLASDNHQMVVSWDMIDKALGRKSLPQPVHPKEDTVYPKTGRTFWDDKTIRQRVRRIDYDEFIKGEDAFWQTLLDLGNLGLVFLKNVPRDENSIVNITTRIANIKETFYGRTFDVKAKPDAENVAYTSGYLGLHQDLLYLERPPAIQLLHCLENSCSGGESLFADGLRAGKLLWAQENQNVVGNLSKVKVPYHYEKHGYFYQQKRPLFNATDDGILANVFWSPPFQNQFPVPAADLRGWLGPAKLFEELINDEKAMYQVKMEPGECVIFDNIRVMHGRTAFDVGGGSRWLRGAYIEREDFVSRVLHIPQGMAQKYRGNEWDRKVEDAELRSSPWHDEVKSRLATVVQRLEGTEMKAEDVRALNGEF